jgi:hypothetical protein
MARKNPEIKSNPREGEPMPKAKVTGPGITSRRSVPDKRGLQLDDAKADKKFNRGAAKRWIPKGGHSPQKDMKVPPPKEMPVGRGAGYDGSKGYTKK